MPLDFGVEPRKRLNFDIKPTELWAGVSPEKVPYKPPLTQKEKARAVVELVNKQYGVEPTPIEKITQFAEKTQPLTETALFPIFKGLQAIRGIVGAVEPKLSPLKTLISSAYKGVAEPEKVPPISVSAMKAYPKLPWQAAGTLGTLAELGTLYAGGRLLGVRPRKEAVTKPVEEGKIIRALYKAGRIEEARELAKKFARTATTATEAGVYAGVPVPKNLIEKFNITPIQLKNIQKGIYTGLAPQLVKELTKLSPKEGGGIFEQAKKLLTTNTFKDFEIQGYMGLDPKYEPQGISRDIWKKAAEEVGFKPENLTEYQGNYALSKLSPKEGKPTKAPEVPIEKPKGILPTAKVKPLVRKITGQYRPVVPTIKEPQALREVLKREQQVGRLAKKETKEVLKTTKQIKAMPIEGMTFEEKNQIEDLKTQLKTTRTLEDLRNLYTRIQQVKEIGKQKYIQTKEARQEKFKLDKEVLLKTIQAPPRPTPVIGLREAQPSKVLETPKVVRAVFMRPTRVFDMIDNGQNFEGTNSQYFYHRANQAEDVKLRSINQRTDSMTTEMARIGIPEKDLLKTREIDGMNFTVDEMLSIYTGTKNKEKILALVHGNKIPYSTMRNIVLQMTPQEKALGDAIIAEYEKNYERLRKAFIDYTDGKTDLGKVEGGYTPIRRTMQGYIPTENELASEMLERTNLKKAFAERGFTKERVKIPKEYQQPIRLGELALWNEQMSKQEHFISYGNLVKELQHMSNDRDFSQAIINKFGEPYLKVIRNWVNRVANPNIYKAYAQGDKVIATLRQNAAIAYLGINLITMLKQAPSLALFLSDVTVPELISGIYDLTTDYKNNMEMIHRLSPQMKNRSIERELEELKNTNPNKYLDLIRKYGEKAMFGIYEIDKLVTHSGWLANFNKYTREGLSDVEAADRATRAVLRTQPAAHAKDLPELYATGEIWNALLQFSNQINQIYNILSYDIPTKARTGHYRDAMRTAMGVAVSAYLIYWMATGKPPTTPEEIKEAIITSTLNYIPLVGRGFVAKRKGFDFVSIPALSGIEATGGLLGAIGRKKPLKALQKGAEAGAVLAGIPYAQTKRIISGGADLLRGRTRDPRRLLYSEYTLKQGKSEQDFKLKKTKRKRLKF